MTKIQKINKFCIANLLLAFVSIPASAIMDGQGHDIFPATAIFKSSVSVIYSNALNAGITISSGLVVTNGTIGLAVSGGNVGIGTTEPGARLEVQGATPEIRVQDTGTAMAMTRYRSGDWATTGNMYIGINGATANAIFNNGLANAGFIGRGGAYPLQIGTNEYARITIDSSGSVGVGTTEPTHKLHVDGNAIVTSSMSVSGSGLSGTTPVFQVIGGTMTVLASGNIGIGLTSPGLKMHITSPQSNPATSGSVQNGGLRIGGGDGSDIVLDFGITSASPWGMWMQSCNEGSLGSNYNMVLNPNGGNVGIGTTDPGATLDINGNISSGGGGIRWKTFSGAMDADTQTAFAHGLTNSKVLGATTMIQQSTNDVWIGGVIGDANLNAHGTIDSYRWYISGVNFVLDNVGTSLQGRPYRVLIFYVD